MLSFLLLICFFSFSYLFSFLFFSFMCFLLTSFSFLTRFFNFVIFFSKIGIDTNFLILKTSTCFHIVLVFCFVLETLSVLSSSFPYFSSCAKSRKLDLTCFSSTLSFVQQALNPALFSLVCLHLLEAALSFPLLHTFLLLVPAGESLSAE